MSTQHIPRTWRYQRDKEGTAFVAHSYVFGPKVTVHCAGGDLNHAEPDMRLIAAAPELLDALQYAIKQVPEFATVPSIANAIAKATGGAAWTFCLPG
jgi:hypothetical protein